jgi:hypothetical protein
MSTKLKFTHKHYIPILKTKTGELWALSHLRAKTQSHLTPLLELHAHKDKSIAAHADAVCENLAGAWGTDDPFFLDTIWLHGSSGNPAVVSAVFESARDQDLKAIPVVRTSYDTPTLAQISAIVEEDGRGCMLRITPHDLVSPTVTQIDSTLAALELAATDVHLLLDYHKSAMLLVSDIPRVPHLQDWLTFTTASGMFPSSLGNLPQGVWHFVPRGDWTSWEPIVTSNKKLSRRPTFGDYTVRAPGPPADFGQPSVNVRYTTDTNWLVRLGGKVAAGASGQMKQLCQDLINRPEYSGQQYSAGDQAFYDTAQPGAGPGNATQWVQWSVSHHLVFVTDQIQNHPSL